MCDRPDDVGEGAGAAALARFRGRRAVPWSINPGDGHLVIDMEYVTGRRVTLIRRHGAHR
ncbi:hypothetical protein EEB14_37625 [Rhodococcus sp. WS4]|nr:hypothetical protein EEB14_37625 [Rhodococcus sp. WS4]